MTDSADILFTTEPGNGGDIGFITLNRPKALNALNPPMFVEISNHLKQWGDDDNIKAVIIRSNDPRAFCAGGDIRYLYQNIEQQRDTQQGFFDLEYQMNAAIFHFKKPYIALLHGITMGGGAGVSIHGSHRVAALDLKLAMPETGIGFFPDIAAGHFLSRCPGQMGLYLGLTGNSINASDAYQLGLVDAIISQSQFIELEQVLLNMPFGDAPNATVTRVLQDANTVADNCDVCLHQTQINEYFTADSVVDIINNCQQSSDAWCRQIADTLKSRSPTSLVITFQHLKRCATMDFDQIIAADLKMARQFLFSHDFGEGIRAMVIDKDKQPQWQPPHCEDVTAEMLADYL